MSKIALTPSATGTGVFTISSPATSTNRTLVLPDEAGTVLTSASSIIQNAGPAFSAYMSSTQPISLATSTKAAFNTENFDTNSCFDTTLYRFTPTITGYYQVNASLMMDYGGTQFTMSELYIYKNGVENVRTRFSDVNWYGSQMLADVFYMNGSTDYLEVYGLISGGSDPQFFYGGAVPSHTSIFSAFLVRAA